MVINKNNSLQMGGGVYHAKPQRTIFLLVGFVTIGVGCRDMVGRLDKYDRI